MSRREGLCRIQEESWIDESKRSCREHRRGMDAQSAQGPHFITGFAARTRPPCRPAIGTHRLWHHAGAHEPSIMAVDSLLTVHPEVRYALHTGQPVVALESTLITHGMPFPDNLQTARLMEQAVRSQGAVPATIALLEGRIAVGLPDAELEQLAALGSKAAKASSRDLAPFQIQRVSAGTTVAATMRIAAQAGIRVFATGGIG